MFSKVIILISVLLILISFSCSGSGGGKDPILPRSGDSNAPELWIYCAANFGESDQLRLALNLLEANETSAWGYEKVIVTGRFLDDMDEYQYYDYFKGLRTFCEYANCVYPPCNELGVEIPIEGLNSPVEIIPMQFPIGHSESIIWDNSFSGNDAIKPNLLEPIPVRDCLFEVNTGGTKATVIDDPIVAFENSTFDDPSAFWSGDGNVTHIADDGYETPDGCVQIIYPPVNGGPSRITQYRVPVKPWQCYYITFGLKFMEYDGSSDSCPLALEVLDETGNQINILYKDLKDMDDWEQYADGGFHKCSVLVFNSTITTPYSSPDPSGYAYFTFKIGMQSGEASYRFRIDDVKIRNAGFNLYCNRDDGSTPVSVKGFLGIPSFLTPPPEPIEISPHKVEYDPAKLSVDLDPQVSFFSDGDVINISYYTALWSFNHQLPCCLTSDDLWDISDSGLFYKNLHVLSDYDIDNINFDFKRLAVGIDELRIANLCALCERTAGPPGMLLGDRLDLINQMACSMNNVNDENWEELLVWSDMFDPYHNAVDNYWMVNGSLKYSWMHLFLCPYSECLPWTVLNWHHTDDGTRLESLIHFNEMPNVRQVLCGYYDNTGWESELRGWGSDAKGMDSIRAVMFTSFVPGNLTTVNLEPFSVVVNDIDW